MPLPSVFPPGPRNRFPGHLVFALRADTLDFLTRTTQAYGDLVPFRVGPWLYVLVSDPETVRDVLVTQAERFTKGPALRRSRDTLGDGLLTSEGEFHRRQRRLSQPAFHPQRVAGYAEAMVRIAERTAGTWEDGRTMDAHEAMMQLALRIVAKTLFDADVEAEVASIGAAMDVSVKMFSRAMTPWAALLNHLPLPSNFRFRRARRLLNETIERFIAERRREGVDRGDLLSMLLKRDAGFAAAPSSQEQPGKPGPQSEGMTDLQLRNESLTLFTAGHETTANALTFTWHLLSQHAEVEARLHEEIDAALGGRLPTAADLEALPYTRAVLSESMRLYPPAWAVARQAKEPVRLAHFEGVELPAGSVILMSQWVMHRDPRWWPEPGRFDPGRWLDPGGGNPARPRYAYFPFGGGPRNCIGESFAWTEAILVLATVARHWRLRAVQSEPIALRPTITLRPRYPLPMGFERRRAVGA